MVDENFKLGIELEIDSGSLADITKQVERAVKAAFDKATAQAKGGRGAVPPVVAGGAATARSAREATRVTSKDFTDAVGKLARENHVIASRFDDAAASVVAALSKLTKAIESRSGASTASIAKAAADATSRIVERQVGPTNKNLARDIQKSRQEAGRQTASSGGTSERRSDLRTGTRRDQPNANATAQNKIAARDVLKAGRSSGPHPLERQAEAQAKAVAASLDRIGKAITGMGKLGEVPDLLKKIGLPTGADVRVGQGASVEIKTLSGQAKTVTSHLRIVGNELSEFTDIVSKRVQDLISLPEFTSNLERAERTSRRDPERAIAMLRKDLKGLLNLPIAKLGGAQSFEKAGEAVLEIDFSGNPELQDRLSKLKDEAAQVALLNKELWNMSSALAELRKRGGEVIGSIGLSEEHAAKAQIIKGEGGKPIGANLPVQIRDLAGMIMGGRGGMRWARSFQPQQAREMVQGERPGIMGRGESLAYETGMFKEKMTRTLKTAYVDPRRVPEAHEDMILLDKKAAEKMSMWEPKITRPLKTLAEDLQAGQKLIHGQVLGFDVEGTQIKFDLKGAEAEVESVEEVVENGIKGLRIKFKELYEMQTGSKMTTTAGFKGVVRVEENMAKKYGLPEGTEAAITGQGAARRGVLSDPMKMIASQIAEEASSSAAKFWRQHDRGDETTPTAQNVADRIEEAMRQGGKDLVQAAEEAAKFFGVGFNASKAPMSGDLPWMRLKEPREPGSAEVGNKYYDLPAMRSLSMRAGTDKMAEDMMSRMSAVTAKQVDFVATLQALAGASDVASENLHQMLPEEFKRLPPGVGAIEEFADTILDPRFREALAIRMPARGGAESLLRMPAIGKGLGARGTFETPLGAKGSDPITRKFDQMLQTARDIRVAEGRISPDVTAGGEIASEAAHATSRAIKDQVESLTKLNLRSEEGAVAADKFVNSLLPLIEALNVKLTEPIQFFKLAQGQRVGERPVTAARAGGGASEFIKGGSSAQERLFRLQDVLAGRTARKGGGTENVPTKGEVFQNANLLQKVMEQLGVTLKQDADAVDKLYSRLEKLEEGLVGMYSMLAFATPGGGKPGSSMKTPYAAQLGAGLSLTHKELTAVQMRTDVDEELGAVHDRLEQLAASGKNVNEAMAALDRMANIQGNVAKIPRDAVFINKQDWDNLVQSTMKQRGVGQEEAEMRLSRPGLLHRYPTTGGASFLASRAMVDPTGQIPPGKIGVPGPMAATSPEDLAQMLAPLREFEQELYKTIEANKGQGAAAEIARSELEGLIPAIQKLTQLYLASALNLDFDGDKISFLADTATAAGAGVETFTQKIERGSISFQQMMANVLGKVSGGGTGNVQEYAELFSKVAKGRSGDLKRAVLMPETAETAQFEAQAHIGGKKSVGLLTDAFNKIMVAITAGTGSVGDAFATGMDYIMLNINKSLAQKSGGGGTAGPLEFLEDLRGGNLDKISQGMRSGEGGIYAEMGEYNKQMRDQMSEAFKSIFHRRGGSGLKDIMKAEGIEDAMATVLPKEDITYGNYVGVVEEMVNQLDLEAIITRMFMMMKDNMRKALQKQGMGMPEVEAEMAKMFTPGKQGKIPGLNVDRLLGELAPEYLSTRQAQVKGLREVSSPMEQAQEALRILARNVATEVEDMSDEFNLEETADPRKRAAELAQKLTAWYQTITRSFTLVGRQADFKRLTGGKLTDEGVKNIGGLFKPGRTKGDPGEVFMSFENRIKPFLSAIKELQGISEGAAASPEKLNAISSAIKALGVTLSHEKIHQLNKIFKDAIDGVVRSLQSGSTAIGREAPRLLQALSSKPNIKRLMGEASRWKKVSEDVGDPQLPQLKKASQKLFKSMGEELLAYQTDPATFKQTMQSAGVADDAIEELSAALNKLVSDAAAAGDTFADKDFLASARTTMEASSEVKSLAQALAQLGGSTEGAAQDVKQLNDVMAKLGQGEQFINILQSINERLTQQEAAVVQGTGMLGLPTIERKGGKLNLGEGVSKLGVENQFPILTDKIKGIMEAARAGFPDVGMLAKSERELTESANDLRAGVSQLEKDKESGIGRGTGHKLFQKVWREFHQAVSVGMINKARDLQRQIGEMRASGEDAKDPGKLRDLLNELNQTVLQHEEYLARSLKSRGRGRGTMTSHIATAGGELVPAAVEAGIKPSGEMLDAQLASIAGYGKEGKNFMTQMGKAIEFATAEMKEGKDISQAWFSIMSALKEQPDLFHTNLVKVSEILSRIAVFLGTQEGKYADSSTSLMEMVKHAKALARALEGKVIKNAEDLNVALTGAPKQAKTAAAMGAGPSLAESVKAQYAEAESAAKSYQARLQGLISDQDAFGKAGRPKHFAPITKDIIDPSTGKVIQQVRIEAKRMGDTIVTSMKNATNSAAMFGNQMRSALRRVVQWGFASGAIYGLVRAFRSMIDVVVTVQNKMTELKKVMDTSVTDFNKLQNSAVSMAKNFGVAIEDVLDGMVVYGQQGLKMGEIMERTKATLVAVNTTTLDSTEATEALTAAHKVFGDEIGTSLEFVDAWAQVAAKHAVSAEDLADAVKRSGSAASVAGVSFQDFLGIVTSIGSVTRQSGKEVATATKFMFRTMRSGAAQKQLGRMGIQSLEATGDYRPAMDVLKELAGVWGTLSRAQQVNVAQSISGIRHYNQFIVLMENFDEALLASSDAQNSQGFAMKKNALAMETFAKQMQVMKETVKGLGLSIGKSVLPAATSLVKGMSFVVDIVSKLPDPILTAIVAFGGLALAGGKAANVIVDSMDAIMGGDFGDRMKKMGGVGMFGAAAGGVKDIGKGLAKSGNVAEYGVMASGAMKARNMVELLGSSILTTVPGLGKFAGGLTKGAAALRLFAGASGIGLVIAAVGGLIYAWNEMNKTGDDVAKEYEDLIGRSQDYTSGLRGQVTNLERVALAFNKLSGAANKMKDLKGMKTALEGGTYKSASVAAQKYSDTVAEVSNAMGTFDPTKIRGISDTGDLIIDLDKQMKGLTMSAVDAQNAITVAFQGKVISAFTKDINEAKGAVNKIKQWFSDIFGGDDDFSTLGQMKELQEQMKDVVGQREALASAGYQALGTEQSITQLTEKRAELAAEILESTGKLKQVMDEMPRFEDLGMAAMAMGPSFFKGAEVAQQAGGGRFGRGATEQSIMFGALAKQAGLGGVIDYKSAMRPGLLSGSLAERGVRPTAGMGGKIETGDVAIVGENIAKKIVEAAGAADLPESRAAAQTLIAGVDQDTGNAIYYFVDSIGNKFGEVTADRLGAIVEEVKNEAGAQYDVLKDGMIRFQRQAFQEAAEQTEKLLTMTFTGAMAGVRVPKGGMPDIGLATKADMSAEQRTMSFEGMAVPLQRLADIQAEMTQITKEYSEDVLTDVEGAYARQAENAKALKVMTSEMVELVMQLQEEGFKLSVIGHFQKAVEDLNVALDQAARAARDAKIEEETRAKFLVQTSGAMAGLAELPSMDFGKTFKELTSVEKLALESPGFAGGLRRMSGTERDRESQVQLLTDLRKQRANFDEIVRDLGEAGEKMTKEQKQRVLERADKGLSKDTVAFLAGIEQSDALTQQILQEQTGIEQQQASLLEQILGVLAGGESEKVAAQGFLKSSQSSREARGALASMGQQLGPESVSQAINQALGIQRGQNEKGQNVFSRISPKLGGSLATGEAEQFEKLMTQYMEIRNAMSSLEQLDLTDKASTSMGGPGVGGYEAFRSFSAGREQPFTVAAGSAAKSANEELGRLEDSLFGLAGVSRGVVGQVAGIMSSPAQRQGLTATRTDTHLASMAELDKTIEEKKRAAYARFHEEELKIIAGIEKSTQELMAKEPARLAIAARDFATSLENMITEFKKAEALYYDKEKSDIEGPFARVGQPGFKNTFEQRREELRAGSMQPVTLEQMRQRSKDLASVKFDEKEATIKQQQDIEVANLRTQQSQAEQFRQIMADALFSGQLEGTGLEGDVKNMIDTLTQELATSEQADPVGDELFFKGVPALEEATRMAQKAKDIAQQKASEALGSGYKQYITDPITSRQDAQTALLTNISSGVGKGVGGAAPSMVKSGGLAASMSDSSGGVAPVRFAGKLAARSYTGGIDDRFVKEQTFKLGSQSGVAPMAPDANTLRRLGPISKVFSPGSEGGPLNTPRSLQDFQVGRTNRNIASDIAANRFGNSNATSGDNIEVPNQPTPGSRQFIQDQSNEALNVPRALSEARGADSESLSGAIASLSERFDSLAQSLAGLTELGSRIEDTTAAVEALQEGLDVNITSGSIEVSNLAEISDTISSSLGGVGAEVTDLRDTLRRVETVVDPDGVPIDERLAGIQVSLDTAVQQVATDIEAAKEEIRIEASDIAAASASENTEALQTRLTELETLQADLQAAKDEQARLLETINTAIEATKAELDAASEKVDIATDTITTVQEEITNLDGRVVDVEEKAESALEKVEGAETLAQSASEAAATATDTANSARTAAQQETTLRENADREISAAIDRIDQKDQTQDTDIKQLQKVSARSDENAKLALSGLRRN